LNNAQVGQENIASKFFYGMKGLIAKKLMMSQAILPHGKTQAITILQAPSNVIRRIKTVDKDGYFALQLAFPSAKAKKAQSKEFRFPEGEYKVGESIAIDIFQVGDKVDVTGISKGKGFAGTIKRHHFKSGPGGHGHDHHRAPGSIGPMGIARVLKGKRMAGRLGATQITVKNLEVVALDKDSNLIAVSGALPGANKQLVIIKQHGSRD